MSKINVLSFEVANLIAAGEVVDRPSSVLKELMENSIDSGAHSITAEIRRGGVALIRVSDDGCGMDSADLPLSIKRHATSKISKAEDLDSIFTLGFRGEALAAISSVSRMTIISKTKEAETATMLVSDCGRVEEVCEVGAKDGTSVLVEDLFANVPARRKFLKKDVTEAAAALAVAERIALSNPSIAFRFISDGNVKFATRGDGNLMNTVYEVYGRDFATKLIECDGETSGITVRGYIGRSDNVRNSRNMQTFFINGRYVKSKTVMAALEQGFSSFIAPEKFPVCVLFIDIDPERVDVNVHPAKLEVKFSDERAVFESVYYTVRSALSQSAYRAEIKLPETKKTSAVERLLKEEARKSTEQLTFSGSDLNRPEEKKVEIKVTEQNGLYSQKVIEPPPTLRQSATPKSEPTRAREEGEYRDVKSSLELLRAYKESKEAGKTAGIAAAPTWEDVAKNDAVIGKINEKIDTPTENKEPICENLPEEKSYRIIGEAFLCYILVECEDRLLLVDKHAAHERINFEEMKRELEKEGRVTSQPLMIPIELALDTMTVAVLEEHRAEIEEIGFEFETKGPKVYLYSIPSIIGADKAGEVFSSLADGILTEGSSPELSLALRREKSLYQIACKASIKGGRSYGEEHIEWLIERVMALPDITVCPHGRPIAMEITKNQLDRNFDRLK